MDILTFDSHANLVSDPEKAMYIDRYEAFYEDFILAQPEMSVLYSSIIQWTKKLKFYEIAFMVNEIKIEIEKNGVTLNGIRLSIDDKKAIVSMEIPINLSIPVIIQKINNAASKII